ncbi:Ribonuclease/ribotoxin [Nemania sp. NC0429]|nr:Ribonuclease/ribotoxin [Nemania sp. NC0429]
MFAAQSLLLVAATLSASVFAAPSGADKPGLEARFNGYNCGGWIFTGAEADNGFLDAIMARRNGTVYNGYPHVFRNGGDPSEVDPTPCRGKTLFEFPILTSGQDYTGGPPGPHRVVVAPHGGTSTAYDQCFLMTHQGASGNLFIKCTPQLGADLKDLAEVSSNVHKLVKKSLDAQEIIKLRFKNRPEYSVLLRDGLRQDSSPNPQKVTDQECIAARGKMPKVQLEEQKLIEG